MREIKLSEKNKELTPIKRFFAGLLGVGGIFLIGLFYYSSIMYFIQEFQLDGIHILTVVIMVFAGIILVPIALFYLVFVVMFSIKPNLGEKEDY